MLNRFAFTTGILLYLGTLPALLADKCITCKSDTFEDCFEGEIAAEYEGQRQECSASLPFCEVTVQERLASDDPDAEPELRYASRGCIEESRFHCGLDGDVRTCTATCQGDLCNDFDDVAKRVNETAVTGINGEEALAPWVIPVAVVVPLVVIVALIAFLLHRASANRRKARDLKTSGGAHRPLNGDASGE